MPFIKRNTWAFNLSIPAATMMPDGRGGTVLHEGSVDVTSQFVADAAAAGIVLDPTKILVAYSDKENLSPPTGMRCPDGSLPPAIIGYHYGWRGDSAGVKAGFSCKLPYCGSQSKSIQYVFENADTTKAITRSGYVVIGD